MWKSNFSARSYSLVNFFIHWSALQPLQRSIPLLPKVTKADILPANAMPAIRYVPVIADHLSFVLEHITNDFFMGPLAPESIALASLSSNTTHASTGIILIANRVTDPVRTCTDSTSSSRVVWGPGNLIVLMGKLCLKLLGIQWFEFLDLSVAVFEKRFA
jgi:hypothetical protein